MKTAAEHGKHVIIASEPTTFTEHEWELIPANSIVTVDKNMEAVTLPIQL